MPSMLQVRIGEERVERLKAYARAHGCSMVELVSRWVDALDGVEGVDVPSAGPSGMERLIALAERQVELLEGIANNGAGSPAADAPTPMGEDEVEEGEGSVSGGEESEAEFSSYSSRLRARSVVVSEEQPI